jgi:hypothetical protein
LRNPDLDDSDTILVLFAPLSQSLSYRNAPCCVQKQVQSSVCCFAEIRAKKVKSRDNEEDAAGGDSDDSSEQEVTLHSDDLATKRKCIHYDTVVPQVVTFILEQTVPVTCQTLHEKCLHYV